MLAKSKLKVEEMEKRGEQDAPYFNKYQQKNQMHMYKQPDNYYLSRAHSNRNQEDYYGNIIRHQSYQVNITDHPSKKFTSQKNQIIKQLRQQYEILKNLSIDDNILKSDNKDKHRYSENSSLSSSMHSKKISKVKESDMRQVRHTSKEIQSLHIQKKQLEIVISNSMRKIQELLNNEILLKKTIHELKNQIEGKGGISQEYQRKIKLMLKTQEQLHAQINRFKHQNERNQIKIKELNQKIRHLQNQLNNKDREIKIGFEQQRKLHELIKLQKDKYLHLEIQCKTYKMEYDLLQKQKNNQINRLKRDLKSFQGGNDKQMVFMVKRLEDELKQKDRKYSQLLIQFNKHKFYQPPSPHAQDKIIEKSYLQEILTRSKKINEDNTKNLADNMNIILMKMAQIQKKNEQALKKSRDQTKRKPSQYFERPSNQNQISLLEQKIRDLQRMLGNEQNDKRQLFSEVKRLKQQKFDVQDKIQILQRKIKDLEERNADLQEQIRQLNHTNNQTTEHTSGHHQSLREQINIHLFRIKQIQSQKQTFVQALQKARYEYSLKEKRYEDQIKSLKNFEEEIRALQRKNDELRFEIEKAKKNEQFNLNMLKTQQQAQIKRIIFENQSVGQKLRICEFQLNKLKTQTGREINVKQEEFIVLKTNYETLLQKSRDDLDAQKAFYETKITQITTTHIEQIKVFNEKFLHSSTSNQKLLAQISHYSSMESELNELRRYLRQSRTMNQGIDHLWQVKQTQYNNINEILNTIYH